MKYKAGIALGGGGSRGFAHLGVLKALEEENIKIDVISGTSAGSIVGTLLADGKTSDEIFDIIKEIDFGDFMHLKVPKNGFISLDDLREKMAAALSVHEFSKLKKPCYVTVANLLTGEVQYLQEGNIPFAVQASSSIPVVFTPVTMHDQVYVDGGLIDNVPVRPLVGQCEKIIAVDVMPVHQLDAIDGILDIALRTFHMGGGSLTEEMKKECTLHIQLDELVKYHVFEIKKKKEIYDIGYEFAKKLDLSDLTKD